MLLSSDEERLFGKCVILKNHLRAGTLWYADGEVVGSAADGTEVSLGAVFTPDDAWRVEIYLAANPTPDMW